MPLSITRRAALAASVFAAPMLASSLGRAATAEDAAARLADLEARNGGRLGVAALDVASGKRIGHRVDERFPMCSTFKALAAAFVLARVDRGEERLDRRVVFAKSDLVPYSPVTEKHVGPGGISMAEICEAAVTLSDNTAGNLMLASFGGPAGLTAYFRSIGDEVSRLDRTEPTLNEAIPGDPRDTTSPAAALETLRRLVLGDALSEASRAQLATWLVDCKTGAKRLRAGLPQAWRVGDKTGSGERGSTNDIAVIWPPDRGPIVVVAYYTGSQAAEEARSTVLAEVGRIVAAGF
jgi:beta-lactamase class A